MVSYYWPRQYPRGFGKAVLRAFETHLANSPGRRDLRFKPELDLSSSVAQFWRLPMNDTWEDADLLGPFTYLMTSSKVRNGCCPNCKHVFLRVVFIYMIQLLGSSEMCPCRIPDAWHRPMWDFYKEYKSKADPSSRNNTIGLNNYLSN